MNLAAIEMYLQSYGMIAVFVVVFLEYLGLPGFPAGVIMPAAGIFAAKTNQGLVIPLLISVLAGLLSSTVLYIIGFYGGSKVLEWFKRKFPKFGGKLDSAVSYIDTKGYKGIFISRLIPAVRTMTSIPAGMIKLDYAKYAVYSALGIVCWNTVFIGAGYLFGEVIFTLF